MLVALRKPRYQGIPTLRVKGPTIQLLRHILGLAMCLAFALLGTLTASAFDVDYRA
jgi:hypothetical protein